MRNGYPLAYRLLLLGKEPRHRPIPTLQRCTEHLLPVKSESPAQFLRESSFQGDVLNSRACSRTSVPPASGSANSRWTSTPPPCPATGFLSSFRDNRSTSCLSCSSSRPACDARCGSGS